MVHGLGPAGMSAPSVVGHFVKGMHPPFTGTGTGAGNGGISSLIANRARFKDGSSARVIISD